MQTFLTKNGYVEIDTLKVGDKVMGKDGIENEVLEIQKFTYDWFEEQNISDDYKWVTINGIYTLFNTQNIYVAEGDYTVCHARELEVGWKIYDENGAEILIESITTDFQHNYWYKLTLDGDHSYIGNGLLLHNASRFWVGGGSSTTWNATSNTNWSATSGGGGNASVPGITDDATFDGAGASGNTNAVTANTTFLSLTITSGYTATINKNANFTIAGNVTLNTSMTWTGAGTMTVSAASTFTWGGVTWNSPLTFTGSNTKTFVGNGACSGVFTGQTTTTTINKTTTETFTLSGGITINGTTAGTCKMILTGGTWSGVGTLANDVDFQGNVTLANGVEIAYNNGTMTYVSGTITTTGNTIRFGGTTLTLNVASITFNDVKTNNANTVTCTLSGDLNVGGNFSLGTNTTATQTFNGAFNINVGGNLVMNSLTTGLLVGTATIIMTGASPTLSMTAVTTGSMRTHLTLSHSGVATFTGGTVSGGNGGFRFGVGAGADKTFTINSGTVTISDRLLLQTTGFTVNVTCNVAGITLAYVWVKSSTANTINFNGTNGLTIGTLNMAFAGDNNNNVIFKFGNSYTFSTTLMSDYTPLAATDQSTRWTIKSDTGGSKVALTLLSTASQNLYGVNFIDTTFATAQTVFSFATTLSNTTNIISTPTAPTTVGS